MKSLGNGDGATMTPLEVAQDILANRDDDRCALNNFWSQKLARYAVELSELLRWRKWPEEKPKDSGRTLYIGYHTAAFYEVVEWSEFHGHFIDRDQEEVRCTHWRPIGPMPEGDE